MALICCYAAYGLCISAGITCRVLLRIGKYLQRTAGFCSVRCGRARRRLGVRIAILKRGKAVSIVSSLDCKNEANADAPDSSVVGRSRTVFITEVPVLKPRRQEGVKPFKSIQLEMVAAGEDVETEQADPDDYDTQASPGTGDIDGFGPYGEDGFENEMNNSSGVSFEELSEAGRYLDKEDMSPTEMEKAAEVLDRIDGTELFWFIVISDTFEEKARAMMKAFREKAECVPGKFERPFNINDYIG